MFPDFQDAVDTSNEQADTTLPDHSTVAIDGESAILPYPGVLTKCCYHDCNFVSNATGTVVAVSIIRHLHVKHKQTLKRMWKCTLQPISKMSGSWGLWRRLSFVQRWNWQGYFLPSRHIPKRNSIGRRKAQGPINSRLLSMEYTQRIRLWSTPPRKEEILRKLLNAPNTAPEGTALNISTSRS